jgi:hypothetical protein
MRNISGKSFRENKTNFIFNNVFSENLVAYEIKRKNTVEPGRPQMTIRRMRIASWIRKATGKHLEYVIFIVF